MKKKDLKEMKAFARLKGITLDEFFVDAIRRGIDGR
jgi:hypothetical protein